MQVSPKSPGSLAMLLAAALAGTPAGVRPSMAAVVSGTVTASGPVADGRVTLFVPDLSLFHEVRTNADGGYVVPEVGPGTYRLGCAVERFAYSEREITVVSTDLVHDFALVPESEPGRWDSIGTTEPEFLDATDIGVLLTDGRIFYCHDTTDPILFDVTTGEATPAAASGSPQGCMNGSLLEDGTVILAGGQDGAAPGSFVNGIPWVKRYDPTIDRWYGLDDLQHDAGRWYPGMARLADGSFLVMGGGQSPDASRTATCERFDLATRTWTYTGSMLNPSEFSPSALLHDGLVLATWWPPQLYDPDTGLWRATGSFTQSERGWPGHADHSLVVLADGSVLALGVLGQLAGNTAMGERFDPALESWSSTSSPALLRFQTEVVQLPDGRVLVAGGQTEAQAPPVEDLLGIVKWTDLYTPETDTWRRVADMREFREYHAVTLLVPDGRVVTTGGTNIQFSTGPRSAMIEAYAPPYLFRGVRPEVASLSTTTPSRGETITLEIEPETMLTDVVLMGMESVTHWVSAGIPRRLVLPVKQTGSTATVALPTDENLLPVGHYMLFAMVDDIPSGGRIIQVMPDATPVPEMTPPAADVLRIERPAPNPFAARSHLSYHLGAATRVTIRIFDPAGRRVRTLLDDVTQSAGRNTIAWDGSNDEGRRVAPGRYAVVIRAGEEVAAAQWTLLR